MTIELYSTSEVQDLWAAITSGRVSYLSYAALNVAIARPLGSIAEVLGDAGMHTDPVSGLVVSNTGVYRRAEAGWQRIASLGPDVAAEALGYKNAAQASAVASATSAAAAATARDLAQQYGAAKIYETYAALTAVVTPTVGDDAFVLSDTGTHTDPVTAAVVSNSGYFTYYTAPAGWKRVSSVLYGVDQAVAAADRAEAAAPSVATVALRSAIRTKGFFPQPVQRLAVNDRPTVSSLGFTNFDLAGSWPLTPNIPMGNAKLQYLHGPTVASGVGYGSQFPFARGGWANGYQTPDYFSYEFTHTGTAFETSLSQQGPGAPENFRILVNDCQVHASTQDYSTGGVTRIKVVFPASGTRRIRLETSLSLVGINVASTSEVSLPTRVYPLMSWMGDSFSQAYYFSQAAVAARQLGFNLNNASMGATGILAPGTGGKVNWQNANRLTDLTLSGVTDGFSGASFTPALGVLVGSVNDNVGSGSWGGAASLLDAIYTGTMIILDAWQVARGNTPFVVFGPSWPSGVPDIGMFHIRDGMQQACARAGSASTFFVDQYGPNSILRAGVYSNAGDQASLYTGSADGVHPTTYRGQQLDGLWKADQIKQLVFSQFA